jgi:hypothetical protein
MATFNIAEYMINDTHSRMLFKLPQFKPATLSQEISITNTFKNPILYKGIISKNIELKLTENLLGHNKELLIYPNETVKLGSIELSTS